MERELSEIKKENNSQWEMIRRHDRRHYSNVTGATGAWYNWPPDQDQGNM